MKEKIINYIETLEAKAYQSDYYFKQRNELYISNQEKDKEIETHIKLNKQLLEDIDRAGKEIERLNNIINELEKWLVESIEKHTEDYIDWKYDKNVYLAGSKKLQNVFDKLQELKHKKIYGSADSEIVYFDELGSDKK